MLNFAIPFHNTTRFKFFPQKTLDNLKNFDMINVFASSLEQSKIPLFGISEAVRLHFQLSQFLFFASLFSGILYFIKVRRVI